MAENNLEITYIPYGLDEISQLDLMTNLANGVEGYLGSRRWARKDKYRNAWLAAYLDIISRGLTGASNDSGIWTINHGQEAIPLDSKSNLEKEMYQDAAYYIQLQMAKMTPRKKEEEKKKEDLTPFKFKESFGQLLLNNRFGGDSSLFGDPEQGWNTLDARDEKTGLRGTAKRREAMASELEAYLKTIEDGKFNFEGTSFKDENDARTKIQTAINALRNTPEDESDDIPAFNALGLNYRGFFSNGGNDIYGTVGDKEVTYQLYYDALRLEEEAKTKAEKESALAKLKALRERAQLYKNSISPFNNRQYLLLTPELILELKKNAALKHKWGEGLTDDMIADLTALGLDSVSAGAAFAPGYGTAVSAISGIGATLAGAYADRARGESWGSTLGTAGFGLSMDILGLIPGLGVAGKAAKMARVVSKGAKWMGPILGGMAAMSYGPGAISAFNKFISGKHSDITAEELRDFTYAMRAIATGGIRKAGSTYQGNRTLARAKVKGNVVESTTNTPHSITIKGKKYDLNEDEFKVLNGKGSRESKIELLKKKGINESDIEWKGINPVRGRIKPSSKSSELSGLLKGSASGQLRWNTTSSNYKGIKRISNENFLRNYTQMSGPFNGTWLKVKDRWNGNDIISDSLHNTNISSNIERPYKPLVENSPLKTQPKGESSELFNIKRPIKESKTNFNYGKKDLNKTLKDVDELFSFRNSYGFGDKKVPMSNGYGQGNTLKSGTLSVEIGGEKITFKVSKSDIKDLNAGKVSEIRGKIARQVLDISKKHDATEVAKVLLKLKKRGWLKQGGQINPSLDTIIEDFIKNNNI